MVIDSAPAVTGTQLGYARVSTPHQSLDQQMDALTAAGVDATRVYTDKLSGTSTRQQRPGLAALLDYARQGDAIVVVGIDRLGRNAAEVMTTIRDLGEGQDSGHHAARGVRGVDPFPQRAQHDTAWPRSRMVVITSAALRPNRSMPTTTMASPCRA